jgi:hypothetical protein
VGEAGPSGITIPSGVSTLILEMTDMATKAELLKEIENLKTELRMATCPRCSETMREMNGEEYCEYHRECDECGGDKEDCESDLCDECDSAVVGHMTPFSRIP